MAFAAVWMVSILAMLDLATAQDAARDTSGGEPRAPTIGSIYPTGQTQSPLTPTVVRRLRQLAAHGDLDDDEFIKVGASATVNRNFLRCLSGPRVVWGEHEDLETTRAFFDHDSGHNPYLRDSLSATVGWHAGRAVWGSPPPLVQEARDTDARFAVVMYGTNDIELGRPHLYASLMGRLVRMLTVRGVIPVLTTIMPRDDDPDSDRYVSLYNAVVRGIAQSEQVPLIDYHRELAALPDHGLASDGIHPNVRFVRHHPRGCEFDARGLTYGYNIRNLITLRALDRLRRHVLDGEPAPDSAAALPPGQGSRRDPIHIDSLPFSHASDTSRSPHRDIDRYGCGEQDESGPEVVYRVEIDEPMEAYALVTNAHGVDVDLHVLRDGHCVHRANEFLSLDLEPGTYDFAVDTFVGNDGDAHAGRYLFVVGRTDQPSDPD